MTNSLSWLFPSSIAEAKEAQNMMAQHLILEDAFSFPRFIGGMDVSNNLYDPTHTIYAAVVVLDLKELCIVDQATCVEIQHFPYVPGLLGFREAPALVNAYKKLSMQPDMIMVDGHGISHPRGLGIASHLGVLLDIPTIGVAKTPLVGKPQTELSLKVKAQVPLIWEERQIASLYRTKARANPLIISTGHRVSLPAAIELVTRCLKGYRLPEPTRHAHNTANACRRQNMRGLG